MLTNLCNCFNSSQLHPLWVGHNLIKVGANISTATCITTFQTHFWILFFRLDIFVFCASGHRILKASVAHLEWTYAQFCDDVP